jgi:putative transposase
MSRYRLVPSAAQEAVLLRHCAHARYVWNLCVEQESHWRAGRGPVPGFSARCRQLTEARADSPWLAEGSVIVQQQDLKIANMTRSARGSIEQPGRNVAQKAGLNREILRSGWGLLVRRLEDKAPGRVQKVSPAFTSQRCSACGHIAAGSRESQALFRCVACGYTLNADVNAARNIAAGHAVTARGGVRAAGPVNREPQPLPLSG